MGHTQYIFGTFVSVEVEGGRRWKVCGCVVRGGVGLGGSCVGVGLGGEWGGVGGEGDKGVVDIMYISKLILLLS